MEIKKPVATLTLAAFVGYTFDAYNGGKLFIDAPPATVLGTAVAGSSVAAIMSGYSYGPTFFNTVTDELIAAPVVEKINVTQS
jgi:hypothetical protein